MGGGNESSHLVSPVKRGDLRVTTSLGERGLAPGPQETGRGPTEPRSRRLGCCQRNLLWQTFFSVPPWIRKSYSMLLISRSPPQLPSLVIPCPGYLLLLREVLPQIEEWVQSQGFFPGIWPFSQRAWETLASSCSLHLVPPN